MSKDMWHITTQNKSISTVIAGCPESGIEAVDFRREHGLSEQPSNKILVKLDIVSEKLVRRFPKLASRDAKIEFNESNGAWHVWGGRGDSFTKYCYFSIPPTLAAALENDPSNEETVGQYLDAFVAAVAAEGIKRQEEAAKRAEAERQQRAEHDEKKERDRVERVAQEQQRVARLAPFFTAVEKELAERGRLSLEAVEDRLVDQALTTTTDKLADVPRPEGFRDSFVIEQGHKAAAGWRERLHKTWTPSMLATAKAIEAVTGHPVESIVEYGDDVDPLAFNTHVNVEWQPGPLPISVHFHEPETE